MPESRREKMKEVVKTATEEVDEELKKSDEEILFPEAKVGDFVVKPWTLGQLLKINPHIEKVFAKLEEKRIKLTLENVNDFIVDLYFAALPEVVEIMAISLDVDQEKLHSLQLKEVVQLIYTIFIQNQENLKNVLSLLQMPK